MKKDPTEFRDRFARWKAGEKVYENGLPKYGGGKSNIDFYDDVTKHIILKEGFLAAPKDIGDGKITIGSGLTHPKYINLYKRNGNRWSEKENYAAVKDTIREFEAPIRNILPEYDRYPAEMRKAILDIMFNIGEGGLRKSTKFLTAMRSHNWNEAKRLMDWDNSDPLFGNGARKRNAERAALFDAGLAHWSPTGPVELMMENKPVFVPQPVFVPLTKNNTDYSIETMTSPTIPLMLNSRNSGDSPLYGGSGYSFRLPSIKEVVERLLFLGLPKYGGGKSEEDAFYERMLQRQAQLNSPTVLYTRANGNPVAFDTEGNLVDLVTGETGTMMLPEVRITPKRYDAYHSTFDPDIIRNFTDWLPVVGDIGTGIDIKNAIKNQNYLEASLLGGMAVLPAPLAKGANKLFRPLIKKSKRLSLNIDFTSPLKTNDLFEKIRTFHTKLALSSIKDVPTDEYSLVSGVSHFQGMPQTAEDVLRYLVLPRTNYFKQNYDEIIEGLKRYGYNTGSEGAFVTAGEKAETAGFFDPSTKGIALKEGFIDFAGPHEFRHRMQVLFPYRNSMSIDRRAYLTRAYDDLFDDIPNLVEKSDNLYKYPNMALEKETTNLDARRYALENFTDDVEMPYKSVSELNAFLDGLSDDLILEAVENSNGYGRRFVHFIKNPNEMFANRPRGIFYSTFPKKIAELRLKYADALGTDVSNLDYDQMLNIDNKIKTRYARALRNAMKYYGMFTGGTILSMPVLSLNDK